MDFITPIGGVIVVLQLAVTVKQSTNSNQVLV